MDADGAAIAGPVHPGTAFYLRPRRGSTSATVTMTVPGSVDGYGGRVLAGVARDESTSRFTPLALAVPAELVVDFDVDWSLVKSSGEKPGRKAHIDQISGLTTTFRPL